MPTEVEANSSELSMKNGAVSRSSVDCMNSATSSWLWIGQSSSRNSSPEMRDSMSESRKSRPSRFDSSTSSASPTAWP